MFVLHDCSICFEDYDALRIPHSISCGHVFCRPCLDSLVSSAPNCPNCRASFGRESIRKVVCTYQDSPLLDLSTLSEAEMMMWQDIESAVESADEREQRKSLVRDNSKQAVQEAGFSKNMLVALDVVRLLVRVESGNVMGIAHVIEESLRDRIHFLEAQLNGTKGNLSANLQDIQTTTSRIPNPAELSPAISGPEITQIQPPVLSPAIPETWDTLAAENASRRGQVSTEAGSATVSSLAMFPQAPRSWEKLYTASSSSWTKRLYNQSPPPRPPPSSTRTPTTAACDHVAHDGHGLSLTAGESVELINGSGYVSDDRVVWVWCRARGEEGVVPWKSLNVRKGVWSWALEERVRD